MESKIITCVDSLLFQRFLASHPQKQSVPRLQCPTSIYTLLMFPIELVGVQGTCPSFQACRFPHSLGLAEWL